MQLLPDAWFDGTVEGVRARITAAGAGPSEGAAAPVGRCVAAAPAGVAILLETDTDTVTVLVTDTDPGGAVTVAMMLGVPVEQPPDAPSVTQVLAAAAAAEAPAHAEAALVLGRLVTASRYADTPIYGDVPAGSFAAALRAVTTAVEIALSGLAAPSIDAATPILLRGELAEVPALAAAARRLRPAAASVTAMIRSGPAVGERRLADADRYTVDIAATRVSAGRLIAAPLRARATAPILARIASDGRTVTAEAKRDDRLVGRADITGPVPPGDYRIELWPAYIGPGTLVLWPDGRGEPCVVAIERTTDDR